MVGHLSAPVGDGDLDPLPRELVLRRAARRPATRCGRACRRGGARAGAGARGRRRGAAPRGSRSAGRRRARRARARASSSASAVRGSSRRHSRLDPIESGRHGRSHDVQGRDPGVRPSPLPPLQRRRAGATRPKDYEKHLDEGGKMMVTLAGAMSTAELGLSLAEMIRQDKVHVISCTGANLEEDVFNLVAHDHYVTRAALPGPDAGAGAATCSTGTSTASPTPASPRRRRCGASSRPCSRSGRRPTRAASGYFPHEFMYRILLSRQARRAATRSTRRTPG